jgi:hypothetical protein
VAREYLVEPGLSGEARRLGGFRRGISSIWGRFDQREKERRGRSLWAIYSRGYLAEGVRFWRGGCRSGGQHRRRAWAGLQREEEGEADRWGPAVSERRRGESTDLGLGG